MACMHAGATAQRALTGSTAAATHHVEVRHVEAAGRGHEKEGRNRCQGSLSHDSAGGPLAQCRGAHQVSKQASSSSQLL